MDDWSLKYRQIVVPMDFISYSLIRNDEKKFFSEDTIETLRQKLIEDVERLRNTEGYYTLPQDELKQIINKRFGVKE